MKDYLRCDVCGAEIAWRVETWHLFFRRIWRLVHGRHAFALDAFVRCSRAVCDSYAHFWSAP